MQRGQIRIQAKKTVQFQQIFPPDSDTRPGAVVAIVPMGHHHIQTVRPTAQENHHQRAGGILLLINESSQGHDEIGKGVLNLSDPSDPSDLFRIAEKRDWQ